jgi:hypothetical protein
MFAGSRELKNLLGQFFLQVLHDLVAIGIVFGLGFREALQMSQMVRLQSTLSIQLCFQRLKWSIHTS